MLRGVTVPHLRIARPTAQLDRIARMYREGLELEQLGGFEDHDGFDGVMLGHPDAPYHLELTCRRGHALGPAPDGEHLLVLYLPDPEQWQRRCEAMSRVGFRSVTSINPYWDRRGRTFEDADGYRVVIHNAGWPS